MKLHNTAENKTKTNILDAFWALYKKKAIETISIKDIVEKAGYNRSTFYEYFIDIYDVLETIENELIPSIETLPPITIEGNSIGMPIHSFVEVFKKNQEYYTVLFGPHGDPSFVQKLKSQIKTILINNLSLSKESINFELDYALEFIISGMIGIMIYWLKQSNKPPEVYLFKLIKELMPQMNPLKR